MIKINLLRDPFIQSGGAKGVGQVDSAGPDDQAPEEKPASAQSLPVAGILACMIVAGIAGGGYYYLMSQKIEAEEERKVLLEQERDTYKKYFALEQQFRDQKESLKKKEDDLTKLKKQQQLPVYFLQELGSSVPENIWFVKITCKGPKVEIKGESLTEDAIYQFRNNLVSRTQWFKNVNPGTASRKDKILEFTMTFEMVYPT